MFKVGQMWVGGQCIQDKLRVMIIKAGLGGIKLMLLPMRGCVSFGLTTTWVIAQSFVWEYINRIWYKKRSVLFFFITGHQSHHHTFAPRVAGLDWKRLWWKNILYSCQFEPLEYCSKPFPIADLNSVRTNVACGMRLSEAECPSFQAALWAKPSGKSN